MGYALAAAGKKFCPDGETVLISGPVNLPIPDGVRVVPVESAEDMLAAVKAEISNANILIMAAAVADYRPATVFPGKIKKSGDDMVLKLERTPDILFEISQIKKPDQIFVGFAAETEELIGRAIDKMRRKKLDWIAANDIAPADRGFESADNAVTLLGANGERVDFPLMSKGELAEKILARIMSGIKK